MPRKRPNVPAKAGQPAASSASPNASPADIPLPVVPLAIFALAAIAGVTLYYGDAPLQHIQRRLAALTFLAAPDQLFLMWCGGKLANFSVLDRWPIVVLAATTLTGAWLAGRLALWLLGVERWLTRLEQTVFALGVGLNLFSLLALAVGLAGGLAQRWIFLSVLAILALANCWLYWRGRHLATRSAASTLECGDSSRLLDIPHNARSQTSKSGDKSSHSAKRVGNDPRWRWWLVLLVPLGVVLILGAMLPPWDYDVREYHLQAPKEWFQNGRIEFFPHNIYANMPLGSELNGVWSMALAGGREGWWWGAMAGKTVMATYSLIAAAALVAVGRRIHSLALGIVAAVLFLAAPWIIALAVAGYNEGPVALYALLAIFALWLADKATTPSAARRLIVLGGFCAGSAVACKYPPLLFLVFPLAVWVGGLGALVTRACRAGCADPEPPGLVVDLARSTDSGRAGETPMLRAWRRPALHGILFAVSALAACGPWFAKNWALTGNPTYPLLFSVFDGQSRTPEKDRQWTRVHSPQPDQAGRRFTAQSLANELAWNGWRTLWASLTIPPLAAVAWLARRQRRLIAVIALWAAFVFLAWWLATHRLDRFLVLLLPLAALVAAIGAFAVEHPLYRTATLSFVAGGAVIQFVFVTLHPDNRYFAPLAQLRDDDREFGLQGTRVEAAHRWLNEHAQPDERVLLVGDAEPFDLKLPAIYNTCFDNCQFTRIFQGRSRSERLAALRAESIRYVFFSWSHLARYRSPGNYGYTSDYPTPELVHAELVHDQRLLIPIDLGEEKSAGELFRVADEPNSISAP